jgi:hypothetical protein
MKEVEKKRLEDEQRMKDEDERAKAAAGCNPVIYQHCSWVALTVAIRVFFCYFYLKQKLDFFLLQ